jgi:Fe-Mn family superoxide dismutase
MAIRQDFGSLEQLKSTVSAAAMGLSSSGWIWVAVDGRATMGVIPTFGAGTLLVRSRGRVLRSGDLVLGENYPTPAQRATPPHQPIPSSTTPGPNAPQPTATRSFHTSARVENIFGGKAVGLYGRDVDGEAFDGDVPTADFEKIGTNLYPLFCVSVHEHAWLTAGYGIWGKEEYLKRFWTVLDWKKVNDAFNLFAPRRTGN